MFTMVKAKWYMFLMRVEMWYMIYVRNVYMRLQGQLYVYLDELKRVQHVDKNAVRLLHKAKYQLNAVMVCKRYMNYLAKKNRAKHDKYKAFYNEKLGIDC